MTIMLGIPEKDKAEWIPSMIVIAFAVRKR